jgi:hypothetical protein
MRSSLAIWELFDLSELEPVGSPWASLDLSAFGCFSWGPAPHLTALRTIWSKWTRLRQSPLACCKMALGSLFKTVHVYCTLCIYCIFLHSDSIWFLSFIQSNIQFKCYVSVNFQFQSNIVRLLLSDIVQYSDPGNVFQVFRSHKEV